MRDRGRVDLAAETDAAWVTFRRRLADRLELVEEDDYLLLEVESAVDAGERDGAAPYVQFCGYGGGSIRAEAVSDHYLDDRFALGDAGDAQLVDIGWEPPEPDAEPAADHNYVLDSHHDDVEWLATVVVRTLRDVYGCPHPAFVASDDFVCVEDRPAVDVDAAVTASRAAELSAVQPQSVSELQALVDAALEAMFEGPAEHDSDGDIPITCGLSRAFVRVCPDLPAVEFFAHLVVDVEQSEEALEEVNRRNVDSPGRQLSVVDGMVLARMRVLALPFVPSQLRAAVDVFCSDLDELAESLVDELGGRRFLEPAPQPMPQPKPLPPRPRATTTDLSVDALEPSHLSLTALLEVLHEDDDLDAAVVATLVGRDRATIVRHLVAIRTDQVDLDGHDEDLVLHHLRRALRHLAVRETRPAPRRAGRRREHSRQLALLPDDDSLDGGSWDADLA